MASHVRYKCLLGNLVAQVRVFNILHHTDDLHFSRSSRIAPEPNVHPDGISPRKIFARELFVDNHRGRRPTLVLWLASARRSLNLATVRQTKVSSPGNRTPNLTN